MTGRDRSDGKGEYHAETRSRGEGLLLRVSAPPREPGLLTVTPAKAGVHSSAAALVQAWTPAFARLSPG